MALETALVQVEHALWELCQFLLSRTGRNFLAQLFPKPPIGGSVHTVNGERTLAPVAWSCSLLLASFLVFAFLLVWWPPLLSLPRPDQLEWIIFKDQGLQLNTIVYQVTDRLPPTPITRVNKFLKPLGINGSEHSKSRPVDLKGRPKSSAGSACEACSLFLCLSLYSLRATRRKYQFGSAAGIIEVVAIFFSYLIWDRLWYLSAFKAVISAAPVC